MTLPIGNSYAPTTAYFCQCLGLALEFLRPVLMSHHIAAASCSVASLCLCFADVLRATRETECQYPGTRRDDICNCTVRSCPCRERVSEGTHSEAGVSASEQAALGLLEGAKGVVHSAGEVAAEGVLCGSDVIVAGSVCELQPARPAATTSQSGQACRLRFQLALNSAATCRCDAPPLTDHRTVLHASTYSSIKLPDAVLS